MAAWRDLERQQPEFAQRVRTLFDARRHKTIATLRSDGSPRISGIEAAFEDGEVVFGSIPNGRKGADLHRDPRFALHSATTDIAAVVHTHLDEMATMLVIDWWTLTQGLRRIERD